KSVSDCFHGFSLVKTQSTVNPILIKTPLKLCSRLFIIMIDGVPTRISNGYDHINLPPTSLTSLYKPVIFHSCHNDASQNKRTAHRPGPWRSGPGLRRQYEGQIKW
ncbi:hypothetical protein PO909_029175, partial [Leuciscus waleckii]